MISEAFHEGGWGMWLTAFLGTLALALAIRHALSNRPQTMPLIVGLGAATLFSGCLGFVTGFMATLEHIHELAPSEQQPIMWVGVRESLNNVALALVLTTLLSIAAGIASYRSGLSQ